MWRAVLVDAIKAPHTSTPLSLHLCAGASAAAPLALPARPPAAGVGSPAERPRYSAGLRSSWLTERWGVGTQGGVTSRERRRRKRQRERAQPLNTRQQHADREREGETQRDWLFFFLFFGGVKAQGAFDAADMNWKETLEEAGIVFLYPEIFDCKGGKLAPPKKPSSLSLTVLIQIELHPKPRPTPSCSCCSTPPPLHRSGNRDAHGDP